MLLKKISNFSKTVTFRLSLWYTIFFGISFILLFLFLYGFLIWHLRKQIDNELLSKAKEFDSLYDNHGITALQAEFQREAASKGIKRVIFQLLSNQGKVLASSNTRFWNKSGNIYPSKALDISKKPLLQTVFLHKKHYPVRILFMRTNDGNILKLGLTLRSISLLMEKYRETFGVVFLVVLICGGISGGLISRKAMAGVQRVTNTALQIKQLCDLKKRVSSRKEGLEIDKLVHAFNEMLDWIEMLMTQMREVTDNIAHDLRSPITRIRGIAETTLMIESDIKDLREMAARIIEESDHLIEIINTMLEITKLETGVSKITSEQVNVQEILEQAVDLFYPMAEDKRITINLKLGPQPVFIQGDKIKLQRAVANLLDNAIKYTPSGGIVTISMHYNSKELRLEIADTGIGISKEELPRIFDRFYRGDKSRSTPGSGLGLSLAQALIRAHGGDILAKSIIGKGSKFTVILPYMSLQG